MTAASRMACGGRRRARGGAAAARVLACACMAAAVLGTPMMPAVEAESAEGSATEAASPHASASRPAHRAGAGPSALCGGRSGASWSLFDDAAAKDAGNDFANRDSIFMRIDTSQCGFARTPAYIVSVAEEQRKPSAVVVPDEITLTAATADSVTVMMWHPSLLGSELLKVATEHGWAVNWAGEPGANGGCTAPSHTPWRLMSKLDTDGKTVFFADVATRPLAGGIAGNHSSNYNNKTGQLPSRWSEELQVLLLASHSYCLGQSSAAKKMHRL